ncbi:MAG: methyltransferase domain-containing protein [Chlamydiota bacterium]
MKDFWNGVYYKKYSVFQETAALKFLKEFPFNGIKRVLDIGCGTGNISKWMADRLPHGKVIGIDPSQQMLGEAVADYKDIPNLEFVHHRAETFQFDEPFDLITSFHALHFVKNQLEAFEQIKSALAPEGKVLIRMASRIHPVLLDVLNRTPWRSTFPIENKFFPLSLDRAQAILQQLGFSIGQIGLDTKAYSFRTPKECYEWVMTWVSYLSELSEDDTHQFATEFTEHLCFKEQRRRDIPFQTNTLLIKTWTL